MDFIFNSRKNKIEIFYENQEELNEILFLIKDYAKYKETRTEEIISSSDWINTQITSDSNTHSIAQSRLPTDTIIDSADIHSGV